MKKEPLRFFMERFILSFLLANLVFFFILIQFIVETIFKLY